MKKRILFVDDDHAVLAGLENLLHKERRAWELRFASSGAAALDLLAREPIDLVVSDMRMPGMDGAELLTRVKNGYPRAGRLVLSGHADREALVRAAAVAHQYLSKPCDPAQLRQVVQRTCQLQDLLHHDAIVDIIGRIDTLPSLPSAYFELAHATRDPRASLADVARIVERDPAMSVKVLQLVNSAFFGAAQRITSIRHAVSYLGLDLLQSLVLTAHVFTAMQPARGSCFSIEELQDGSTRVARCVRRLLGTGPAAEEGFTAALLHDLGSLIIAVGIPDACARVKEMAFTSGRPRHLVEQEVLGVSHGEVGGYLLGAWGLPTSIVEVVAYHHFPGQRVDAPAPSLRVLAAVHFCDAIVETIADDGVADRFLERVDLPFLERAGVARELGRWQEVVHEELRAPQGLA